MLKRIAEADFQQTEAAQSFFTVTAPAGTVREDLLDPGFWVHVASRLRPMCEINVIAQDCSWYAKLICLYSQGREVQIRELGYWPLDVVEQRGAETDAFTVQWAGPVHQWRVVRKADGVVMHKGFKTRNEAAAWMFRMPQAA